MTITSNLWFLYICLDLDYCGPWRGWAKVVLLSFLALATLLVLVAAPQQCSSRLAQIVLRTATLAHGRLQRYTVGAHNIQFPSPTLLIG